MTFQPDHEVIRWRLHLRAPVEKVYRVLTTDAGRAGFWAEAAVERDGVIHFVFPNRATWEARILEAISPRRFSIHYYGGSTATFSLEEDGLGGTDLTLTDASVPAKDRYEVTAGWVSVLMALKAMVDFDVDLRNHDPQRHWDHGYCDN